jgi:hypothetical protein
MEIPDSELQISFDQDDEGRFIARVYHKPSATIKISDYFWEKDEALAQAKEELEQLVAERRKGGL